MSHILNVPEIFGSDVFNETVMKQRLRPEIFTSWKQCIENSTPLELNVANEIAEAMKDWAIEKGATHYTHWFQPMTGITAEKHDSFITPTGDGKVNIGDVAKLYAHVRGKTVIEDEDLVSYADISGDGKINVGDVARLYAQVRS